MQRNRKVFWQSAVKEIGPYLDLGMRLALMIVVGVFGGLWLDRKIHTTPLFLILGFFIGAVSGFWSIYRTVYLKNKIVKKREKDQ